MEEKTRNVSIAMLLAAGAVAISCDTLGLFVGAGSENLPSRTAAWLVVGLATSIGILPSTVWRSSAPPRWSREIRGLIAVSAAVLLLDVTVTAVTFGFRLAMSVLNITAVLVLLVIPASILGALVNGASFLRGPKHNVPPN